MSIDIYELCNTEFLTNNVERTCKELITCSSTSILEDIIKLKPHPKNKEGLKYYYSLCLAQIQEKYIESSIEYLWIIDECFELFALTPEHSSSFFVTIDSILIKLIRKSNDNEILKCAALASKLRNPENENPSSLLLAYTKIISFIYRKFTDLINTPKRNDYIKVLYTLTNGIKYGLNFLSLAKKIAKYAIEFLEEINNINQDQENSQESPKEDMEIIRYIEELNIKENDFKTRILNLKNIISRLNPVIDPIQLNPISFGSLYIPITFSVNLEELKLNEDEIYTRTHHDFKVRVIKGLYRNKIVAVKIYSAKSMDILEKFNKEIENNIKLNNSRSFKSGCFIKFYGVYKQGNDNYYEIGLVMKYFEKTLMDYITELKKKKKNFCESTLIEMYKILINSFTIMHDLKIYHLDIKPHNILINITKEKNKIYIIDLGSSVKLNSDESESIGEFKLIQGTRGYMSPELVDKFDQQKINAKYKRSKADVFSLGMTFLQICTLEYLGGELNTINKNAILLSHVENVPYEWAKNIIKKMLVLDPNNRPKFNELKSEIQNTETSTFSVSNTPSFLQTTNFGKLTLENPIKTILLNQLTVDYFIYRKKQELILIKSYSTNSQEILNELAEELKDIEKLSQAKQSNLYCFLKYYETTLFPNPNNSDKNICMVLQYCEKNLMDYMTELKIAKRTFNNSLMFDICKKLIFSFTSMHNMGIYHLNIKPHNILIDENKNLFITGLGTKLNKMIEDKDLNNYDKLIQGVDGYEPPEMVNKNWNLDNKLKEKIDVFSLGMTLLQMITLVSLANYRTTNQINNEILSLINKIPYEWAKNLIQSMICYNPEDRLRFVDLMQIINNIETETFSC
ncbi:hypothetical protein SteCoe_6085 [Stentor coeruleus]|uniref:Protein kinase domain-containing protein n=1 Tax=Stentor coeruleus TaxID=5963 RepID=A0A1R2CR01_9CILI|nr:hypothetical protein SteCoe_6085 [Stentor coeruleus]